MNDALFRSTVLPNLSELESEVARRCELSLPRYIREAWAVVEPATVYMHNWHIDLIAEHLQLVTEGKILRLLINIPPRMMKSLTVSVFWPTWEWIPHPETRFLFTSYSGLLSTKHNLDRRAVIQSNWYRSRWGDRFKLAGDQNLKTEFVNNRRGHMIATSVGGTTAGKGGTRVVIDDPINPEEGESMAALIEANSHVSQIVTRLDNKNTGALVMIMQRVAQEDPSDWAISQGWTHLNIPSFEDMPRSFVFPVTGRVKQREAGELLWPEREDMRVMEELRRYLGPTRFAAQYLQEPYSAAGEIFHRDWFPIITPAELAAEGIKDLRIFVDTALTAKSTSDFTVMLVSALTHAHNVVHCEMRRGQWEPHNVIEQVCGLWDWWYSHYGNLMRNICVEDSDAGKVFKGWLRDARRNIPVRLLSHGGRDKVVRARAIVPSCEAEHVRLVRGGWTEDFLHEHVAFRGDLMHKHDDIVDTNAYAVSTLLDLPIGGKRRKRSVVMHQAAARNLRNQ